jgi:hypothetical protein
VLAWYRNMEENVALNGAIEALVRVSERAGLSVRDLITLLDSGMTLSQILEHLHAKLSDKPVAN